MIKTLLFQGTCNSRPQKIKMRPKAYSRLFGIALGSSLGVIIITLTFHGSRVIYVEDSNEVIPSDQIRGVPIHFQRIDFNATANSDDEDIMDVLYRHNDTEHNHGTCKSMAHFESNSSSYYSSYVIFARARLHPNGCSWNFSWLSSKQSE